MRAASRSCRLFDPAGGSSRRRLVILALLEQALVAFEGNGGQARGPVRRDRRLRRPRSPPLEDLFVGGGAQHARQVLDFGEQEAVAAQGRALGVQASLGDVERTVLGERPVPPPPRPAQSSPPCPP